MMSTPGWASPEVVLEVSFCGFGDMLLVIYSLATIVAFL
jgi:hypothetical protein